MNFFNKSETILDINYFIYCFIYFIGYDIDNQNKIEYKNPQRANRYTINMNI